MVDLKSIDFNSNNIEKDITKILHSEIDKKKWYTSIDYPKSLDYLREVSPNNAFKKAINVKNCNYNDCQKCKFCSIFEDQSIYCLKDYSEDSYKRYNIEIAPDYIHKMDLYNNWISYLKLKNLKNKNVLDNLFKCIHFFAENSPAKGQGSTLLKVGLNKEGTGSLNRSYKISWGVGPENIAIVLEPTTELEKANTLLIKVLNYINYFVPESLHEIKVYKTKVGSPNQSNYIFKDFELIDYHSSPWEEILSFTKNDEELKAFISDLVKLLPEISLTRLTPIIDFLEVAKELLKRNKELYKEDRENILEPTEFSYTYFNINNNIGTLVFGLTGIEKQYGYKYYGAEWEIPLNSNHPITYYKFNKLKDFSQTSSRRFNTWKKEICSSKEFNDRWNYFEDHFSKFNWIQYNDLNKSALSPSILNSTVLGKILFNSNKTLKEFWEQVKDKDYITYEDFRDILLSKKIFSDITSTKFVQYLYNNFELKPDDIINLINS